MKLLFMGKLISVNGNVGISSVIRNIIQFEISCFFWQGILADVSKLQLKEYKFEETENLR